MPSRPSGISTPSRSRVRRSTAAAAATAALLALTATACGPTDNNASAAPGSSSAGQKHPGGLPTSIGDLKKWKDGGWKNWDKWSRRAQDFANPIIKDHWNPERLAQAKSAPDVGVQDAALGDQSDVPAPGPKAPVTAQEVVRPYHRNMAPIGKIFFDSPKGPMVCSGTIVEDPAHPGKSNLVWTAGHCVHTGKQGGWMRNIVFVPSFNDNGVPANQLNNTTAAEMMPYGKFWADWVNTSNQWISMGGEKGNDGSVYDFAVMHVKPENGNGKSLEETVGAAAQIWFNSPYAEGIGSLKAFGYPAAAPYDGARMMSCLDRPDRLTMERNMPPMDRIGCTMTGGSSGGGWFVNRGGKLTLVSNTSISNGQHTWLAGPHLGPEAQEVFTTLSQKFAAQQ
ncbi:trypsin-like serine peptidase [Streptomyces sp. GS7]|uniref:trypsin-like serine peptidase n=1 Tax=Streptomyces sp. GS7 TaxID=2692234 RepID=UPI0013167D22|nr:hypothetical protein [Streptomyces sp. GS7]QHC25826.1 hypothetical protein GR130_35040 [Streptomyces sp. GS7]